MSKKIGLFWDIENCCVPNGMTGYSAVDRIRKVALEYGSLNVAKAYLDVGLESSRSMNSDNLRSAMQQSGLTLVDCPHDQSKDVADKVMIVDMMLFALDNPAATSIVILISGDKDFSYALSSLRNRGFYVLLIAPRNPPSSLVASASEVRDWREGVLKHDPKTKSTSRTISSRRFPPTSFASSSSSYRVPIPATPPLPLANRVTEFQASSIQNKANALLLAKRIEPPVVVASTSKFLPSITWASASNWFSPTKSRTPPVITSSSDNTFTNTQTRAILPSRPNFVLGLDDSGNVCGHGSSTDVFDIRPPSNSNSRKQERWNGKGKGKGKSNRTFSSCSSSSPKSTFRKRNISAMEIETIDISSGSSEDEWDKLVEGQEEVEEDDEKEEEEDLQIVVPTAEEIEKLAHEARKKQRKEDRKLAKILARADTERAMELDKELADDSMDTDISIAMSSTSSVDLTAKEQLVGSPSRDEPSILDIIEDVANEIASDQLIPSNSSNSGSKILPHFPLQSQSPTGSLNLLLSPAVALIPWELDIPFLTNPTTPLFTSTLPLSRKSHSPLLPPSLFPSSPKSIAACISTSMTSIVAPKESRRSSLPSKLSYTPPHPPPDRRPQAVADDTLPKKVNNNVDDELPSGILQQKLGASVGYFFDTPSKVTSRKVSIGWLGSTGTEASTSNLNSSTTSSNITPFISSSAPISTNVSRTLKRELDTSAQEVEYITAEGGSITVPAKRSKVTTSEVATNQKSSRVLKQWQECIILDSDGTSPEIGEEDEVVVSTLPPSPFTTVSNSLPPTATSSSSIPTKMKSIGFASRYSAVEDYSDMDLDATPPITSPGLMSYEDFEGEREAYEGESEERENAAIAESLLAYR